MIDRRYDNVVVGVLSGTLLPVVSFVVLYVVFIELSKLEIIPSEAMTADFPIRTISLVSIGTNVVLVKYFQNRYAHRAVRGVVFPTFVFIIAWILYFLKFLL
mgnify:CR=1 FL=1